MHFFNIDSPIFRFLEKVANLIILNILTIICSIPIVTIGPAFTAMYYVTLKMVRDEESGIIKSFFHSFRENFKQGLVINIGVLLIGVVLAVDLYVLLFSTYIPEPFNYILLFGLMLVVIAYLAVALYIYPVLAKFDDKTAQLLKGSLALALRHLPITVLNLVIGLLPVLMLLFFTAEFFLYGLPIMLLLGFSTLAYFQSFSYVRVFDQCIPQNKEAGDDADSES